MPFTLKPKQVSTGDSGIPSQRGFRGHMGVARFFGAVWSLYRNLDRSHRFPGLGVEGLMGVLAGFHGN